MNRIGVLTSGGDAPGMNACLRAVVRYGASRNVCVVGIKRGFAGLLESDFVELGPRSVANVIHRGGTFLETARCEKMKTKDGIRQGVQALNDGGIEGLIVIGGDGTFRGASELAEAGGCNVVGIPGTIDNDVYGTDYSIGFDTATNTAMHAVDQIRDTAESLQRPFFVEVMGRHSGAIALDVGVAGGADDILIPETETKIDELCVRMSENFKRGKRSSIIVVAEGDEAGGVFRVAEQVWERLHLEYRVTVLGHVQRGGPPTVKDRVLASKLGAEAVRVLLDGKSEVMVGELGGQIALTPLNETWGKRKELDQELLDLIKILAR